MSITTPLDQINPSYRLADFTNDFANYAVKPDGTKTLLDTVLTALDWSHHYGYRSKYSEGAYNTIEPLRRGFSFMGLAEHLNELRALWRMDDETRPHDTSKKVFDKAMLALNSGADATLCLDQLGFYPLKESLRSVKVIYWAPLFFLDSVGCYYELDKIGSLKKNLEASTADRQKEFYSAHITISYLNVIKSITTVAMASICLVSILFAAIAQGCIFNPVVMMGLGTTYLALEFGTYFYGKIIDHTYPGMKV